jgi:hypothetical protein
LDVFKQIKKDLERLLLKIEQIFPYKIQMFIFDP